MKNLIAQIQVGPITGFGPLGLENDTPGGAPRVFANFISSVIGLLTIVAAIWFVFLFITGAIGIISSSGDKNALEDARKKITLGVIGMVVVIASVFVIDLLGTLIGVDFLDPVTMFCRIIPGGGC
jgi:hypothetical protein